jgi:pimeloyl-ACP methyl ester carboxylesterase
MKKIPIRQFGFLFLTWLFWPLPSVAQSVLDTTPPATTGCGELVTLRTHGDSTTKYSFGRPQGEPVPGGAFALVLLPGGSGLVDLDANGCVRALKGNSLVRSIPLFRAAGFFTVLVDAPSDHQSDDGLGGFRTDARHADDLAKIIAEVRSKTKAAVWLVGTSRGAISAANGASRLSGANAPDGVVLTSAVTSGQAGTRKSYVSQSVFDLPLEAIRIPVLVIGHAEDTCVRSPASRMNEITARTEGVREQVVLVKGGPGAAGISGIAACEGRSPHGYIEQEEEVARGIARFVRGGVY